MVVLKIFIQDAGVFAEVSKGNALLEHGPIMHIVSQQHIQPLGPRDEVPLARTEGLAHAVEQNSEAGDLIF